MQKKENSFLMLSKDYQHVCALELEKEFVVLRSKN